MSLEIRIDLVDGAPRVRLVAVEHPQDADCPADHDHVIVGEAVTDRPSWTDVLDGSEIWLRLHPVKSADRAVD